MKPPPFMMAAALLFWGWRTNLLAWAALLAVVLEIANFVSARWDFTENELKRVSDLCMLMVFGEVVILVTAQDRVWGQLSFKFFQWLPVPLFPMMLAQTYGTLDRIPATVFSMFLRRLPKSMLADKSLNISWIYYLVCLVGASSTPRENRWFYPGMALLMCVALYQLKPRRTSVGTWIGLTSLVIATGFAAEQGIYVAQNSLEANLLRWIASYFVRTFDMRENKTQIGQLGRISLSGKIIWRVTPDPTNPPPYLLREASFNDYDAGTWRALSNELSSVQVELSDPDTAILLPRKKAPFAAHVAGYLDRGRGLLALPHGTAQIRELPAALSTNRLGVARVEDAPNFVNYQVLYGPGESIDGPPDPVLDLYVPPSERAVLQQTLDELQLNDKTPREKIRGIAEFLQSKFTYSMNITRRHVDRSGKNTALGLFLTTVRSGHCEYFATATVLLLRQANIPARYVIGYGVQEQSGKTYIVRERHGHAWTLVFRRESGRWEELDTTPASWSELESHRATRMEALSDFFSRVRFEFAKWRYSKTSYSTYLRWLLIPLILILAWRIFFRKRFKRSRAMGPAGAASPWPGLDSEFYLIEQALTEAGMGRLPNELSAAWLRRVTIVESERLKLILSYHRRLRFDPHSLTREERQILKNESSQWLREFEAQRAQLTVSERH